jgi:signal transduction histidine kinase
MKLIGAGSERQHNIHQMMDRQIRHLAHLIEDLLDISRITEGKIKLRKQHMSVKSALAGAVEISMPLIEKNRHKLELEAPESDLYLQADTHRVVQVVSNILNNAAKYTPAGGLIRVTARMDGEDVLISVSDNGVGLAAEDIGTVFDMFTQISRKWTVPRVAWASACIWSSAWWTCMKAASR